VTEVAHERESTVPGGTPRQAEGHVGGAAARPVTSRTSAGLRSAALPLLGVALLVSVVVATAAGAVAISPLHTALVLLNATHLFHFQRSWDATDEVILLQLRLPRVAGAMLVGAALGMAGVLFQGLLRNPLADPLLLGTSSGAALGATIGFILPAE